MCLAKHRQTCAFAKCRRCSKHEQMLSVMFVRSSPTFVRQVVNERTSKDVRDKCWTNVCVRANICSIRIHHYAIFGGSGNNFDQKSGPNLRMVARTSLAMAPSCFSSNFTHQYSTFGKILKTLKMEKKTFISFGAFRQIYKYA